ncbi:hypothetical protein Ptr86124_014224 [Pyrenophora tritici-repentis]|uniref:Uncharacterized protein n=1 Tax=Pyrenophora tritici-repentis TaxID=45151 RepID=A0A922N324_9PLEO|nr:hypothetical protein Ptr86124_014224 [Pyrenophora tritici-repentis]
MAEGRRKGAWASQPSRLRNEILAESIGGQSDAPKHVIQVPHSDTIVLETQLDEGGQFAEGDFLINNQQDVRENSLSPDDQAVIDRLSTTKKAKASESSSFNVKWLAKRITEPINQPVSSDLNGFSFMPIKKAQHKRSLKSKDTTKEVANLASLTLPTLPERGKQHSKGITELAAGSIVPPPRTPKIEQHVPDSTTVHGMGEIQPLSKKTNTTRLQQKPIDLHHTQTEIAIGPVPPVQPSRRTIHEIKMVRTGKKIKKGKKAFQSQQPQQPTVPWPPRGGTATDLVCKSSMVDDAFSANPQDLCKPKTQDGVTHGAFEMDSQAQRSVQGHQAPAYNHKLVARNMQDNESTPREAESYDMFKDMPEKVSQTFPVSSAKHVFPTTPTTASFTIVEQRHVVGVDQHSHPTIQDQSALAPDRQALVDPPPDQYAASQTHEVHQSHVPQIAQLPSTMATIAQPSLPQTGKKAGQPREAEAVLHGVSGRDGSDRVNKPRRKTRVVSAPSPHATQGPSISTVMEQSLNDLKVAIDDITKLQDSIVMWEKKYEESRKGYSKVLDGAKNRQKYLTGLQSDLEQMQKYTNDCEKERKEA